MKEGQASATARLIAAATVMAAADPELRGLAPVGAAAWCERFLSVRAGDRRLLRSVRSRAGRIMWRCIEVATLPGIVRHWLVRKGWIEHEWRASEVQGYTQLVVLGAGLDTLGVRAASVGARVRVIELDHPATQELKREGLGAESGVVLAPCKLGEQRVSEVLGGLARGGGFDPARATMVVCEGVLMYLSQGEVEALLADLASLPVARLRVVVSAMNTERGRAAFSGQRRVVGWWLARRGEPFRSGTTPELLRRQLERVGLTSIECIDVSAADPGGGRRPALEGELLARSERVLHG